MTWKSFLWCVAVTLTTTTSGCFDNLMSPNGPEQSTTSTRPCNVFPGSSGCHGGIGYAVQIVDYLNRSSSRCYDVYLNDYNCKHPGSPACFGSHSAAQTVGVILGHWPRLSGTDKIIIVPQGTKPSRYCFWTISGGLNSCAVETLAYGSAGSPDVCRQ